MNFLKSKWFMTCVIFGVLLFGVGSLRSMVRNHAIEKEIAQLEEKQNALESERSGLSQLLKKMQSEVYAETQAREQFGMRKPGEKSVVISADATADAQSTDVVNNKQTSPSNPASWWLYFFQKVDTNAQ